MKEASKSGAAPLAAVSAPGTSLVSLVFFWASLITCKTQNYKPGKPVSLFHLFINQMAYRTIFFAGNNFPIIMISSSPTALITMHNVKRFLQESVYVHFFLSWCSTLTNKPTSASNRPKMPALVPPQRETRDQKISSLFTVSGPILIPAGRRRRRLRGTLWWIASKRCRNLAWMRGRELCAS